MNLTSYNPTQGVVAAGHPKTAEAAQTILQAGGNAFDAVVGAMLASFVVESTLTSAAGGGFLLAHTHHNQNILFDFFTQTPRHKRPTNELNFYPVDVNFGEATQAFYIGLGSMAVPGSLAGAFAVHQQLGRLPLSLVAEPTLQYARNGIKVVPFQSFCINSLLHPILLALPESRQLYAPQGTLVQTGDTLYMRDFANTLEYIIEQGIEEFYQGDIAHQIAQDCQEHGGYLTLEDLASYQVIQRSPLKVNYRGRELLTNPPPSSGGALIAFALKLLEKIDFRDLKFASATHRQILAQVMALTNEARKDGYDAHIYSPDVAEQFLALNHLQTYQNSLTQTVNKWGSTTHVSVMDEEGNAASATTSNGEGSSYVIPGTGIMINNMLGEADLNPAGFHQWHCNQRISSMMAPTILLQQGKPEIVLGSGGSNRIRTVILQVISNLIDFKMSVHDAVEAPRVHWENQVFHIEPPYLPNLEESLQLPTDTDVLFWQEQNMFFGGVHAVQKNTIGEMVGAGDPRRGGAVEDSKP
ncbi:gamma-glutamyltransferase [Spirulina subsalsa]|uniref:gamma-glutamyltransferase n=1 Tax=Spirulina subsalsa TaxID=54311 RepID=UPI0002D87FEB|nr:gamma-glutamyltransferase [Spirulina subsalsa]